MVTRRSGQFFHPANPVHPVSGRSLSCRVNGFTMVEILVVVLVVPILMAFLLALCSPHVRCRTQARRAACINNCGNMIKCCHLYADVVTNLGQFPLYSEGHNSNGHEALAKLYDGYVKDHRVFSCPSKTTQTAVLVRYLEPDETTLQTGYTNYGYDPGHNPVHATAGVVGDRGTLNATNHKNSTNHGSDGPGQNVAIGAGSVEWIDVADARKAKDETGQVTTDDIFADDLVLPNFPEELETNIIQ